MRVRHQAGAKIRRQFGRAQRNANVFSFWPLDWPPGGWGSCARIRLFSPGPFTDPPGLQQITGFRGANGKALVAAGVKGIILNDGAPSFAKAVQAAQSKGIIVVQSDRKGSGRVTLSERTAGRGVITADSLNAQKARILLRLALTKTTDPKELQRIFNEY